MKMNFYNNCIYENAGSIKKYIYFTEDENGYIDTIALIGDDQIAGSVAYIKDSYQDYYNGASMVAVARKVLELCEW